MEDIYDKIQNKAKHFLNTRHNDVHVPLSYAFARKLLSHYPEGDEEVVLPAILLHDVGWKMVPEDKQLDAFGPTVKDSEAQRFHEAESVRIAKEILTSLNYNQKKMLEIMAIIDGHDTRDEILSLDDSLVKDADKLWRYTSIGVSIDHKRFGIERDAYLGYLENMIERWFFTPEAKRMAREALAEAKKEQATD